MALMIAAGLNSAQIEEFVRSLRRRDLFCFGGGSGIFTLDRLEGKLRRRLGSLGDEELKIPSFICVTDLNSAKSLYLDNGDMIANAVASAALTPIFGPRKIAEAYYIDGGLSDNLPIFPLLNLDAPILAINVNPLEGEVPKGFFALLMRSLMIMLNANIRPSKELAHAYLEVQGVLNMGLFDFSRIDEAIKAGYMECKSAWRHLEASLIRV